MMNGLKSSLRRRICKLSVAAGRLACRRAGHPAWRTAFELEWRFPSRAGHPGGKMPASTEGETRETPAATQR